MNQNNALNNDLHRGLVSGGQALGSIYRPTPADDLVDALMSFKGKVKAARAAGWSVLLVVEDGELSAHISRDV